MWQTIDGRLFDNQGAAIAYEANLVRKTNVVKLLQQFDMSPTVRDALADFIVNNRAALAIATR